MEILKHGITKNPKKRIRFKCKACGCKFIAESTEVRIWVGPTTGNRYCSCKCPECGFECDK